MARMIFPDVGIGAARARSRRADLRIEFDAFHTRNMTQRMLTEGPLDMVESGSGKGGIYTADMLFRLAK